ncbi:DUF6603 domain-containing protein [Actinomadura livida]|uniref:DUF6603 domain-containing protein n=1 Tax=Actinomadura livida TaxID=79909 RepID=A0A7W7II08_9ACTN|nr:MULTISPECIES: DUF6603 domain-containing protein [Actinomadura]MBB4777325.1 hypothetical protein [Actinomadura catellatispora]GGU20039.1 hypothetical protein GCM10010208_51210 [Actinomadura livida]
MPSTVETAAEQVARALLLINRALADPRGPRALLHRLGWSPPPGVDDIGLAALDLSDLLAKVTRLDALRASGTADDAELAVAVAEVAVAAAEAVDAVRRVPDGFVAPAGYLAATRIADEFVPRLTDLAVVGTTASAAPMVAAIAQLCGVFVTEHRAADPAVFQVEHLRHIVRWDRLGALFTDPGGVFREVYGWGTADFHGQELLHNLGNVLHFVSDDITSQPLPRRVEAQLAGVSAQEGQAMQLLLSLLRDQVTARDIGFTLFEVRRTAPAASDGGLGLAPYVLGTDQVDIPIAAGVALRLQTSVNVQDGVALVVRPGRPPAFRVNIMQAAGDVAGDGDALVATLRFARGPDRPIRLLAMPGGAVLEASAFVVGGGVGAGGADGSLLATTTGARLVVPAGLGDAFLARLLGGRDIDIAFDLGVEWSPHRGLTLHGSAGTALTLSLDERIGPVRLRALRLEFEAGPGGLAIEAGLVADAVLGPVTVAVDAVGLRGELGLQGGDLGPFDLSASVLTPDTLGLDIDAGPAQGGGSVTLDAEDGRYSGALAMRLHRIAVRGAGVLDTRLPGGRSGFSLLVLLSARFEPGVELGFGISLTGVGGLVGIDRRIDVDALSERFATGAAARILSADGSPRDLPAVLTELSEVFPPADGVLVVGPTLRLRWIKIVTLDVGVFLEFPGPTRAVVLGTARASVDNPLAAGPLLRLRCDFVGVLDLPAATFAFDAVLVDSHLLETFAVTGGLLLRAGWGDEPYAVLSVGGFHPDFAPGALVVPKTLTRLAMSRGDPGDAFFLRFEGYFAITPNTMQFGAAVEVGAKLGPLRIRGFVGFDALIRREPFAFAISFEARVQVKVRGRTLAGIKVHGRLAGPGPTVLYAKACVEILFFDICASKTFTLGGSFPPAVNVITSALEVLGRELRDPANLRAAAEDRMVALRDLPRSGTPVLAPTGLVWEQTRAPLGLLLERIEGSPLARAATVRVTGADVTEEELDWFAPGGFAELGDGEALNRRSFERLSSGVRLATGDDLSTGLPHTVMVEEFRLPEPPARPPRPGRVPVLDAPLWLIEAALVREGRADGRVRGPAFQVRPERWEVLDAAGRPLAEAGEAQAHQLARTVPAGAVAVPAGDRITLTDL